MMKRRQFLRWTVAVPAVALAAAAAGRRPLLCVFSKHLADLDYHELPRVAKDLGYQGIDLTVRPQGHVLPENAARDMPRAVEAIRKRGLEVPMITTGLTSAEDPAARPTIRTAAELGIPYFKLGYYRYRDQDPEKVLARVRGEVAGLVKLAGEYGVTAGFHNHSGDYVGSPVWDTREILRELPRERIGYYFDPGHATIEGGLSGWEVNLRMALPRVRMVSLKDFYWAKRNGEWRSEWCPMGEGMVRWKQIFALLAGSGFAGPLSMHLEYHARDEHAALRKDAQFTHALIEEAYRA